MPIDYEKPYAQIGARGALYLTSASLTTVATVNVFVLAAGTTAIDTSMLPQEFTVSTAGRLTYTGAKDICVRVQADVTLEGDVDAKIHVIQLALNGSVIAATNQENFSHHPGSSAQSQQLTTHVLLDIETDDYIELFVGCRTDNSNLTVRDLHLTAYEIV